jgi:D-alanine-D-alanine ligase
MVRIRVAVLMGGPSSEHDVSLRGGAAVVDALDRKRYEVRPVHVTRDGGWRVLAKAHEPPGRGAAPRNGARGFDPLSADLAWRDFDNPWDALRELVAWRTDVALPILHGRFGEDGTVQACLRTAGIRFAGSGVRGSAVAIDKIRTKEVLGWHRVPTPRFRALSAAELERGRPALAEEVVHELGLPLVVKDPLGGSTLEVRVCDDVRATALALETLSPPAERLLVEAYVPGREFTAGVLDDRERGAPVALPLVEIRPKSARHFDYREKYDADGAAEICPADLPPALEAAGRALGLRVHELLDLRGVSRTDLILSEDGSFTVLEVNTMPGMTSRSLIPKAAGAAGLDFPAVLDRLVRTAGFD